MLEGQRGEDNQSDSEGASPQHQQTLPQAAARENLDVSTLNDPGEASPSATYVGFAPPTSASTPAAAENPRLSPRRLRSGTILNSAGTAQVGLNKYLNYVIERARESATPDQTDKYRSRPAREFRLAQLENFSKQAAKFRKELLEFNSLSRSLGIDNKETGPSCKRDSFSEANKSEPGGASENTPAEAVLSFLRASLSESDQEDSLNNTNQKLPPNAAMADEYIKVAKLTAQLVPLFSGAHSPTLANELQTFLGCCRRVLQCLTETEKAAFVQIFPTRLRGEAYQLVASSQPPTFEEAEKLLNRIYLPRETYQELVNKLITLRQFPLESLTSFTARLKQQLSLCTEAATAKYGAEAAPTVQVQLEDFAKNALKGGVTNPHLCQYLLTLGDDKLDQLIQKALDMERLQQTTLNVHTHQMAQAAYLPAAYPFGQATLPPQVEGINFPQMGTYGANVHPQYPYTSAPAPQMQTNTTPSITPPPLPVVPSVAPAPPLPAQTDSQPRGATTHQPHTGAPPQKPANDPIAKITCSYCGRRGHTYTDCLKRKNTPFCTICRTSNHDAKDCRQPHERQRPTNPNSGRYNDPRPSANPQSFTNTRPPINNNNNRPVYNVRLICNFCGRRGHNADICRQRQRWETSQQGNSPKSSPNSPARQ